MKKFAVLLITLLLFQGVMQAAPMAAHNPKAEWYKVQTDHYQCTVYDGSMYPFLFKSADGKREFPHNMLLDWIMYKNESTITLHYLYRDPYAKVTVLENTEDKFVWEVQGKFCLSLKRFPGVTARYRYTMMRHSPEILLEAEITADKPFASECKVNAGVMAWQQLPFDEITLSGQAAQPFRTDLVTPRSFASDSGITLRDSKQQLSFGIAGPSGAYNNADGKYYTYLGRKNSSLVWDGKEPLRFTMKFCVQSK